MDVTEDTVGGWLVRAEWDDAISRNAPVRVVIEPRPGVHRAVIRGGITTTVLRRVKLHRDLPPADTTDAVRRLRKLAKHREVSPEYLAALSEVYVLLTSGGSKRVSHELAELVDRAPSTVKAQLGEARRLGLLSEAVPHRPGGELTPEARRVLNGL
jgi:hypothetical protein